MRKWLLALSIAGLLAVTVLFCLLPGERGMDLRVIRPKQAQKIEQEL